MYKLHSNFELLFGEGEEFGAIVEPPPCWLQLIEFEEDEEDQADAKT